MANDPAPAFEQAVAFFQQGRLEEAEKISARMLKAWPGNFDALHLLGVIKLQSGKAGAALGLFESALKANPNSPEALANLAMAPAAGRRENEAGARFFRAPAPEPHRARADHRLGRSPP